MRCPYCKELEDKVIDSRPSRDGGAVRRRRECLNCGKRFTTYEYVEEMELHVIKNDRCTELYDRNKLYRSVAIAIVKRPVSTEQLDKLVSEVESKLYEKASKEIESKMIGDLVMKQLIELDKVAYIRYASVYRRFEDTGAFTEEVKRLS